MLASGKSLVSRSHLRLSPNNSRFMGAENRTTEMLRRVRNRRVSVAPQTSAGRLAPLGLPHTAAASPLRFGSMRLVPHLASTILQKGSHAPPPSPDATAVRFIPRSQSFP